MFDDATITRWLNATPELTPQRLLFSGQARHCCRCGRLTDCKHLTLDGKCPDCDHVLPMMLGMRSIMPHEEASPASDGTGGDAAAITAIGLIMLIASIVGILTHIP